MPFSLEERTALLALKGVGPTVITRLEQLGIDSLEVLGKSDVGDILAQASAVVGSTCCGAREKSLTKRCKPQPKCSTFL